MEAIKPGWFAQVGDLIREGWCTKKRCIAPPYTYGIVLETHNTVLQKHIRTMFILTTKGERILRYSVHVEVISETG